MKYSLATFLFILGLNAHAQLPNGSVAPDWTLTSIDGIEYNLYSILDSGYQVVLDFSATWCGPCWDYHESGVLEELHQTYGPNGTNDIRVFWIEASATTDLSDIYGTGTNTVGDWTEGTSFPILDLGEAVYDAYDCNVFPTIFTICPNKRLVRSGQANVDTHLDYLNAATCAPANVPNDPMLLNYFGDTYSCGGAPVSLSVELLNQGLAPLTSCTIEVHRSLLFGQTEFISSTSWEGELPTYGATAVDLGQAPVDGSLETFTFTIVSEDDETENNEIVRQISSSKTTTNNLEVTVRTDAAPLELGWEIVDVDGNVVEEVLAGTEMTAPQTTYTWNVTLPELGCYLFTLNDAGGDGMFAGQLSSWDDVGTVILKSKDGEEVVEQLWQHLQLDEFTSISFDFEATTVSGIDDAEVQSGLGLFPNPVSGQATVEFTAPTLDNVVFSVHTVLGERMLEQRWSPGSRGPHRMSLDLGSLAQGAYVARLVCGDRVHSTTFIKH